MLGKKYNLHVGIGEAYTHAIAAALNLPSASNDSRALNLLEQKGLVVPSSVIRTYDLLVLTYQGELLMEADCEAVRKALLAVGEPVPEKCRNSGFVKGIQSLNARLLDRAKVAVGRGDARRHQYDQILYLDRV